ncbi:GLUG motif-containing protein [Natrialba swarupiae]|uniref:GLUG domain-containing protein n=1 Tax=Natrialba swarupiae TaxID=2448032 RepID=A0A5D5ALJ9_9EURY|nr:GLUG motif-containing protein [Natrialba swarupiae]TYT60330.1 hypothetical protein FYC77_19410 [Natrialba swarupiae]
MTRRSRLALVLALAVLVGVCLAVTPTAAETGDADYEAILEGMDGDGDGEPYVITNASELQAIAGDLEADYVLGDDVDASDAGAFEPIGDAERPFEGTLDGDGHRIVGPTIDGSADHVGLFAGLEDATVRDLEIYDADLVVDGGDERVDHVGILAGTASDTTLDELRVTGIVTVETTGDVAQVGGLVGTADGGALELHGVETETGLSVTGDDLTEIGGVVGVAGDDWTVDTSMAYVELEANATGDVDSIGAFAGAAGDDWEVTDSDVVGVFGPTANDLTQVGALAGAAGDRWVVSESEIVGVTESDSIARADRIGGLGGNTGDSWAVVGSDVVGVVNLEVAEDASRIAVAAGKPGTEWVFVESEATGNVLVDAGGDVTDVGIVTGGPVSEGVYADAVSTGNIEIDAGGDVRNVGTFSGSAESDTRVVESTSTVAMQITSDAAVEAVGGGVGDARDDSIVVDSELTGTIDVAASETADYIGGVAGVAGDDVIVATSATEGRILVDADSAGSIGAAVGENAGTVSGSTATARIEIDTTDATDTTDVTSVGGLVGVNDGGEVEASYSDSLIVADGVVGGLVGDNAGSIERSFAVGPIDGDGVVGGLVGDNADGTVSGSYWDTAAGASYWTTDDESGWDGTGTDATTGIGGGDESGVTGLETAEMIGAAASEHMDALEFTMAWQITASYPALEWESTDTLEGEGTADDPYVVTDVYELQNVADEPEAHYVLGNDIDATETELWTGGAGFEPIGSEEEPFEGTFDGNGSTISGLAIDRNASERVGLFGQTDFDAVIEDVYLENASVHGDERVGGLVGFNFGSVSNASVDGAVSANGDYAGGLVGANVGPVATASATADVETDGNRVGGLLGASSSSVVDARASGNVSGVSRVGGLVGYNTGDAPVPGTADAEIEDARSSANVSGTEWVGGLVGTNENATVSGSNASGLAGGVSGIGGLTGENRGTIERSSADVGVTGFVYVGGLVGNNEGPVSDSFANGDSTGWVLTGGLVGGNDDEISTSSATGDVDGIAIAGGLVGLNTQTVAASSARGDVSGEDDVGGLVGVNAGLSNGDDDVLGESDEMDQRAIETDVEADSFSDPAEITESFATGNVSGDENVGGLVGVKDHSSVERSYATGPVSGDENVSGLAGQFINGAITDAYWDADVIDADRNEIGGLSTANMTGVNATQKLMFDFEETWVGTDGYPEHQHAVETIEFDSVDDLRRGDTTDANVTVRLVDGESASASATSNYSSANERVATVDNGTIVAKGVGETTLTAELIDQTATATVTVSSSSSSGGSGGGAGAGAGGGPATTEPTVDVSSDQNETTARVENAVAGEPVAIERADGHPLSSAGVTSVERLSITPERDGDFSATVRTGEAIEDVTDSASALDVDGSETLGYAGVDHDLEGELAEATVTFGVDGGAADVTIYQYVDGEWTALETESVDHDIVWIESTTSDLSSFAIAAGDSDAETDDDARDDQRDAADDSTDGGPAADDGIPGFGLVVGLLALVVVARFARDGRRGRT